MNMRYVLTVVLLVLGYFLQAQTPTEPTSATDGKVKIHSGKRWKKLRGDARATEREGQSLHKQKLHRNHRPPGSEARVFKRHNHFSKREKTRRNTRRSSLTRK
jgi:hypothetical protein